MAKSKSKEHRISKQDTNKLLTAIDQVTIPIPDLFVEEHHAFVSNKNKRQFPRTHESTCYRCSIEFEFVMHYSGELFPEYCPDCEDIIALITWDINTVGIVQEFVCNLCEDRRSILTYDVDLSGVSLPKKAPSIDDVIPDGFVCDRCYDYCYNNFVINKADYDTEFQ